MSKYRIVTVNGPSPVTTTRGGRGHSAKIARVRCHLDLRHHFFSCRVIDRWNSLPQNVIDSSSVNAVSYTHLTLPTIYSV